MKSVFSACLLVLGVFLSQVGLGLNHTYDTSGFVLVKESDGITLYERWYEIEPELFAREIKATFTVKAPAHAAVSLIRDESKGTEWNKNTRVYKILPRTDDSWFGYIEYDLPWPVSNQDCVLYYKRMAVHGALHVAFSGTEHPSFPVIKKIQRIPEISGKWIFEEDGDNVHVEYYVTTTPNPSLPKWLTDPIIRSNLLETLAAFRKILEQSRLVKISE